MRGLTGIIDYGISGNLLNVKKAIEKVGGTTKIVKNLDQCNDIDRFILPGVGNFHDTIHTLSPGINKLNTLIAEKPTLGLCLGMQLLGRIGFEGGKTEGFGFFDAEVKRMDISGRIPHLGWGNLEILNDSPLLDGITGNDRFYFMHSYEMITYKNLISLTEYSSHKFVSIIQKDHIFGVQFHPEKSRESGLKIFQNFLSY